ncbi:S9 family peptidase [bacterium]|nr:S9 family peptidase [bacterium]
MTACASDVPFAFGGAEKSDSVPPPPETKKIPETNVYHGVTLVDDYAWLENASSEETKAWTRAQNERFYEYADSLPATAYLKKELRRLWRYADRTVPTEVYDGKRLYFSKKGADDDKWILMIKEDANAPEKVVLDPNKWDKDDYLSGVMRSRDGRYVAYGIGHAGDENPVIHVKDVENDVELPDRVKGWKQGLSCWKKDNSGFYYTCKPLKGTVPDGEEFYWHSVYFHKLGTSSEEDKLIFNSETEREKWHGVDLSDDEKYMLYYRGNFGSADIWVKRNVEGSELVPVVNGKEANFDVTMLENKLFIRTNLDAPKFMVYVADIEKPGFENWKVFIPESEDRLDGLSFIDGEIYAEYLHGINTEIKIYDLDGTFMRNMTLPANPCSAGVSGYWHKGPVRVNCSSYLIPNTTYSYNLSEDSLTVLKEFPVKYDLENCCATQVFYPSKDGTMIPMTIIYPKDMKKDGSCPCILDGYGGFNVSLMPGFIGYNSLWVNQGGVFAIANLRGGGEFGEEWHKAGMREKKQNVFDDFIAAAEYLIKEGYTSKEKLGISGGSNGGLLVGACAMQRPDLYKAVRCGVPLLDMIKYHKFRIANIWSEEYGTSDDKEQFGYLLKYSPYQNIKEGVKYPSMLITGGENDARVDPMHVRKMGAKLQECSKGGVVFPVIYSDAGHGSSVDFESRVRQYAREGAFMYDQLGLEIKEKEEK